MEGGEGAGGVSVCLYVCVCMCACAGHKEATRHLYVDLYPNVQGHFTWDELQF